MAQTFGNNPKKTLSIGILAHVDAGKTTLSESPVISERENTESRDGWIMEDAYLDTSPLERERGITIFSKQAVIAPGAIREVTPTWIHRDMWIFRQRWKELYRYWIMQFL